MRPAFRRRRRWRRPRRPALRFSPFAWAKLLFLRDRGQTEVGGFGVSNVGDLLLVEDVILVRQVCTSATVVFEDEAVADYFDEQVDRGRRLEQVGRVWLHTHPGDSAMPSLTDEATFERVFGRCDWAAMGIVSTDGATYARLRFNAGPGGECRIPVEVDYRVPFSASDWPACEAEYAACVSVPAQRWPDIGTSGRNDTEPIASGDQKPLRDPPGRSSSHDLHGVP